MPNALLFCEATDVLCGHVVFYSVVHALVQRYTLSVICSCAGTEQLIWVSGDQFSAPCVVFSGTDGRHWCHHNVCLVAADCSLVYGVIYPLSGSRTVARFQGLFEYQYYVVCVIHSALYVMN